MGRRLEGPGRLGEEGRVSSCGPLRIMSPPTGISSSRLMGAGRAGVTLLTPLRVLLRRAGGQGAAGPQPRPKASTTAPSSSSSLQTARLVWAPAAGRLRALTDRETPRAPRPTQPQPCLPTESPSAERRSQSSPMKAWDTARGFPGQDLGLEMLSAVSKGVEGLSV